MKQNSARLDLIAQYRLLHQRLPGYGASLTSIVRLTGLIGAFRCRSVLDFGCGKGKLVNALRATEPPPTPGLRREGSRTPTDPGPSAGTEPRVGARRGKA
jgi:hypothetical protein